MSRAETRPNYWVEAVAYCLKAAERKSGFVNWSQTVENSVNS